MIKELENKINQARLNYYNGETTISDAEYDKLIEDLSKLDPNNKSIISIGAEPSKEWEKENHPIVMGSLDKITTKDEISDWINKFKDKKFVCQEKIDGLSILLTYENGKLTKSCLRGNGYAGENIFKNALKIKNIPHTLPNNLTCYIRGEILITLSDFTTHFQDKANPRNAASGVSRRLDGEDCEHLSFIGYQIYSDDLDLSTEEDQLKFISELGFTIPNYKLCKNFQDIFDLKIKYENSIKNSLDYLIDGLVLSLNDLELQKSLGETNNRPKGAKAIKFVDELKETTIKSIDWSVGKMGMIVPVVNFETIELEGTQVSNASLYNLSYINELGLDVGTKVLVRKAGQIIPRIESVVQSTNSIAKPPTKCPSCSGGVSMKGEYLMCMNSDTCPSQCLGKLETWISVLNILEWGDKLLMRLLETGKVKDISDLYLLKQEDLETIDRMGKKSAQKCLDTLWKSSEIPLEIFLGGLSIPLVSTASVKLVIENNFDTLEKVLNLSESMMCNIHGLGVVKSKSLFDGLKKNKELIDRLLKNGVKIKMQSIGKLTGKTFALTGAMVNKRADLEKMIIDAGGTVKGSVGKSCTYLVIANPETSTSSKAVAARKNGTALISEDQLLIMLK